MCLEEAPFYVAVSMTTVQSATPYRQRKRSRESFAALVCDVMSVLRNESTVLHAIRAAPWRRGAPKAQDRCASKRHPFYAETSMLTVQNATPYRQRKRSREIFAALVCDVTSRLRNESTVLHIIRVAPWRRGAPKAQDGSPKRHERQWSGEGLVASDLGLRASPHIYCSEAATTTLNPEP